MTKAYNNVEETASRIEAPGTDHCADTRKAIKDVGEQLAQLTRDQRRIEKELRDLKVAPVPNLEKIAQKADELELKRADVHGRQNEVNALRHDLQEMGCIP